MLDAIDVIIVSAMIGVLLICGIVLFAVWLKETLQQRNRTRR